MTLGTEAFEALAAGSGSLENGLCRLGDVLRFVLNRWLEGADEISSLTMEALRWVVVEWSCGGKERDGCRIDYVSGNSRRLWMRSRDRFDDALRCKESSRESWVRCFQAPVCGGFVFSGKPCDLGHGM